MKSFLKKLIPFFLWDRVRVSYFYTRRFLLDALVAVPLFHPLEGFKILSLIRLVRPEYSMVPAARLRLLYDLSKKIITEDVPGSIVECGTYNGGSAALMAYAQLRLSGERDLWLFDSFEGLPPPTENDGSYERENYYKGWCGGTAEKVEEILKTIKFPRERLHIVKGWFENTFPREASKVKPIALLHVDADWYESVKICIETFYPMVSSGGYIVFDDYGTFSGCKKALHEYLDTHHIEVELQTRDNVGVYFKKP